MGNQSAGQARNHRDNFTGLLADVDTGRADRDPGNRPVWVTAANNSDNAVEIAENGGSGYVGDDEYRRDTPPKGWWR